MLKKTLLILLSSLLFGAYSFAEQFTIGVSWNAKDSELVQKWEDYLISEGKRQGKQANIELKWVINVANADPGRQASNIEDLINQDVDLIMARAEDSSAIGASIRSSQNAGIPFITFDRASGGRQPTAHVGGDSYDQGITTTKAFVELLKKNNVRGRCIELQGSLTDENAVNRSNAWNKIANESGIITTIAQVPTEWNPELFRSGTANALRANPDANCMFLASDFALSAVKQAMESADKWHPRGSSKHIWLATQDVFPEAVKALQSGHIDLGTTYDAYMHSNEAVRVALIILSGINPNCGEKGCLAKGRLATQENIDSLENLWSRPTN